MPRILSNEEIENIFDLTFNYPMQEIVNMLKATVQAKDEQISLTIQETVGYDKCKEDREKLINILNLAILILPSDRISYVGNEPYYNTKIMCSFVQKLKQTLQEVQHV
jgi:hypothetical protein